MSTDKLCKRYLFNLEMIVKGKAAANKTIGGPPRMLYLRELLASIHHIFKEQVLALVRQTSAAAPAAPTQTRLRSCSPTCFWALRTAGERTAGERIRLTRPLSAGVHRRGPRRCRLATCAC